VEGGEAEGCRLASGTFVPYSVVIKVEGVVDKERLGIFRSSSSAKRNGEGVVSPATFGHDRVFGATVAMGTANEESGGTLACKNRPRYIDSLISRIRNPQSKGAQPKKRKGSDCDT